ncbi:MAG: leucine-rich repeat domain-containing protein [Cytophagaceae bacterium]
MRRFKLHITIIFLTLASLVSYGQTVPIADPVFLDFLKLHYAHTITENDELIISEAATVTGSFNGYNQGFSNVEGIQYFTNLERLYLTDNNLTSVPDLSGLSSLRVLNLSTNQLTTLPAINTMTNLREFYAYENMLTQLPDFSQNSLLRFIAVYDNQLTSLPDLSNLSSLIGLEVGNNRLTSFPELNNLTSLRLLYFWNNEISELPPLNNLLELREIYASSNQLYLLPDFSANINLSLVVFDNNRLNSLPGITNLNNLTDVRISANHFSFSYLSYLAENIADFETIFSYSPQKDLETGTSIFVREGESFTIETNVDTDLEGVSYEWLLGNRILRNSHTDRLTVHNVENRHAGDYYCRLYHPDFPSLVLVTTPYTVRVASCMDISGLQYEAFPISCLKPGSLSIDPSSVLLAQNPVFELKAAYSGNIIRSTDGNFPRLNEPNYTLTISTSEICKKTYPDQIRIPVEECEEALITPDGDGQNDTYLFNQTGTVAIYDKNGSLVKSMSIPNEWDGSGLSGKVRPGYYVANINDGEEFIRISVIY